MGLWNLGLLVLKTTKTGLFFTLGVNECLNTFDPLKRRDFKLAVMTEYCPGVAQSVELSPMDLKAPGSIPGAANSVYE